MSTSTNLQTITFEYKIRQQVWITELARPGLVVGLYYGETGQQYQISYFHDGEKQTTYFYHEQISADSKGHNAGFAIPQTEAK